MSRQILLSVAGEAEREKISEAVSTKEGMAGFWTTRNDARPEVGSEASFGFPSAPVDLKLRLEALEPGKRVRWASLGPWPYWDGTTIEWELGSAEAGGTNVLFRHSGWGDDYPDSDFASVSFVWGQVLARLKAFMESGQPQPFLG
jgi:uncharacterized protein YndB with AHSA1/START domain